MAIVTAFLVPVVVAFLCQHFGQLIVSKGEEHFVSDVTSEDALRLVDPKHRAEVVTNLRDPVAIVLEWAVDAIQIPVTGLATVLAVQPALEEAEGVGALVVAILVVVTAGLWFVNTVPPGRYNQILLRMQPDRERKRALKTTRHTKSRGWSRFLSPVSRAGVILGFLAAVLLAAIGPTERTREEPAEPKEKESAAQLFELGRTYATSAVPAFATVVVDSREPRWRDDQTGSRYV